MSARHAWLALAALLATASMGGRAMATNKGPGHTGDPGAPGAVVTELGDIYGGAARSINEALAMALGELGSDPASDPVVFRRNRAAALLEEIRGATRRAGVRGAAVVSTAHRRAFERGSEAARAQLAGLGIPAASEGVGSASFTGINESAVEALARDSVNRMQRGLAAHGERGVGLFRSLSKAMAGTDGRGFSLGERGVNRVIAMGVVSGDPRGAMGLMRRLIGEGLKLSPAVLDDYRKTGDQLIEVGGWSGTVRTYAEMVLRTRTAEAQREGQVERQLSLGVDLAQITGSNSANFCTRLVGLVVVVRGDGRGSYPAMGDLPGGGPPFHPRCTKNLRAYVPGLVDELRVRMHGNAADRFRRASENGTLLEPVRA